MEITLLAKSSSHPDEPYKVVFRYEEGLLRILCNCPAGQFGQFCKHKVSLALKDPKMLFDQKQKDQLDRAYEWVKASSLTDLFDEIRRIERELEDMKKRLKSAKAMAGRVMTEGLR